MEVLKPNHLVQHSPGITFDRQRMTNCSLGKPIRQHATSAFSLFSECADRLCGKGGIRLESPVT